MPPKKLPASKKGGRVSRGGKNNSGAHRGNGSGRDSGSQQSGTRESSDSTNEHANETKTTADSIWFKLLGDKLVIKKRQVILPIFIISSCS